MNREIVEGRKIGLEAGIPTRNMIKLSC